VVIRIGRSRTRAGHRAAPRRAASPVLARARIGEVHQQDGVLGHQAHQHDHADHREHGTACERNSSSASTTPISVSGSAVIERQRLQEALELAGQDHVDEDHRQRQRLHGIARRTPPCPWSEPLNW
jgi:hypothetical protein